MRKKLFYLFGFAALLVSFVAVAATVVPVEVEQPGTQPGEVSNLESPNKCGNCHGGYNPSVEPSHTWQGSMMANATRDPLFWATLAIAEQDFDGVGDLCIRCHSTAGWLQGRSTPTDGSGLAAGDADGVECDYCHALTKPDGSEHAGVQNAPFLANDEASPPTGYYGSGMGVLSDQAAKLGPYVDAQARHQFEQSSFHREREYCGTCHDVSNPVVGDLAHNFGIPAGAAPPSVDGTLGGPLEDKAAFNNFPYQYGVVERTYSEFMSSSLPYTAVADFALLPAELQAGAFEAGYNSATASGGSGDYADGTTRYYTCQTCHMRPVAGAGCNKKGVPTRTDLPLHDMTGGNYWVADAMTYMDSLGQLRLGGGLTVDQTTAIADAKTRALKQLSQAATMEVDNDVLRILNHTGHKLISGYPEGRRMWINAKWYDASGNLLREDGAYGPLTVQLDGAPTSVETILTPDDPNGRVYQAHYGITQEWADQLLSMGYPNGLAVSYDRVTGDVEATLADVAAQAPGTAHESFHFALNNTVVSDNRIPPFGMDYDEAKTRNALPVPETQYGDPGVGGTYDYFDEILLNPPVEAQYASIDLLYQPTSWEYIQFLYLGNDQTSAFLANEGSYLLDAWLATGMAQPYVMATTQWGTAPVPPVEDLYTDQLDTWSVSRKGDPVQPTSIFSKGDTVQLVSRTVDGSDAPLSGAQIFIEIVDDTDQQVSAAQAFSDIDGYGIVNWKLSRKQAPGVYTLTITDVLLSGYEYDPAGSAATTTSITVQ